MLSALVRAFDLAVIALVTAPANQSPMLDRALAALDGSTIFKGGLFVAALCWLWADALRRGPEAERLVVRIVLGLFAALVIGRIAQVVAPLRPRPIADGSLDILWPQNPDADALSDWSSMPSDHAIYFIALATAFFWRSRLLGIAATAWTLLVVLLPRVYFGQHYPSDILAGAAIGAVIALVAMSLKLPNRVLDLPARLAARFPAPFYALAMLVALQMATMFFETREWLHRAGMLLHPAQGGIETIIAPAARPRAEAPLPVEPRP